MGDLIGIVISVALWMLFRGIVSNAKKQQGQQTRPRSAPGRPAKSGGGWADMLGIPPERMPTTFREAMQKIETAFEPAQPTPMAPPMQAGGRTPGALDDFVSAEGVDLCHDTLYSTRPSGLGEEGADACHDYMLPPAYQRPEEESEERASLSGWSLRVDAPSLVQGVVLSEILTRPALWGRGRTWRNH